MDPPNCSAIVLSCSVLVPRSQQLQLKCLHFHFLKGTFNSQYPNSILDLCKLITIRVNRDPKVKRFNPESENQDPNAKKETVLTQITEFCNDLKRMAIKPKTPSRPLLKINR